MKAAKWNGMIILCFFSMGLNKEKWAATSLAFVDKKILAGFLISFWFLLVKKTDFCWFSSHSSYFKELLIILILHWIRCSKPTFSHYPPVLFCSAQLLRLGFKGLLFCLQEEASQSLMKWKEAQNIIFFPRSCLKPNQTLCLYLSHWQKSNPSEFLCNDTGKRLAIKLLLGCN